MTITIDLPVPTVEALRRIAYEHEEATGEAVRLSSVAKLLIAESLVDKGYIGTLEEALGKK